MVSDKEQGKYKMIEERAVLLESKQMLQKKKGWEGACQRDTEANHTEHLMARCRTM